MKHRDIIKSAWGNHAKSIELKSVRDHGLYVEPWHYQIVYALLSLALTAMLVLVLHIPIPAIITFEPIVTRQTYTTVKKE